MRTAMTGDTATPPGPTLPDTTAMAAAARSLARARSRAELAGRALRHIAALGLNGALLEVDGDVTRVIAADLPPDLARWVDVALAAPVSEVDVPVDAIEIFRVAVRHRRSISAVIHPADLTAALHRVGAASDPGIGSVSPFEAAAVPVEAGDELVGILYAQGPGVELALPVLEMMAAQIGPTWRYLEETAKPVAGRWQPPEPSAALAGDLRALLQAGRLRAGLQPVMRLGDRRIVAYEALSRFAPSGSIRTPGDLFAAAAAVGSVVETDDLTMRAAFAEASQIAPATLFANVTLPHLLAQEEPGRHFAALAAAAGIEPTDVVLEVSERDPVPDVAALRRACADVRAAGFRIAIDDAGAGHASMLVIAEVRPEFIKIDHSLIHTVHADAARRALVVSLLSFAAHIHSRLIAEGIEDERELEALLGLGVQWGQGWLLGRPVMVDPPAAGMDCTAVDAQWFAGQEAESFPAALQDTRPIPVPIRRSRTVRQRQRGERLSQVLIEAAQALQAELDPQRIVQVIAEQLPRVVPVDGITIYAADIGKHRFVPMVATGDSTEEAMRHSFPIELGLTGWAFADGRPHNVGNATAHPAVAIIPGTPVEDESLLLIPLVAGDRRLGMLNCLRAGLNRFSESDLGAATLFGHTAAAAWRNAQLYAELLERSMTDPLTGLLNSRWLRDAGEREVAQSRRSGRPLAVVLLDLDHFKAVNDTGGHAAGDIVLQRVAHQLRSLVRRGDAAVRLGGEEFVLILRDTDEVGAIRVTDAVRQTLTRVRIPVACGIDSITASMGIALFPHHGDRMNTLVRNADLAMYAAKTAGRDQAVLADPVLMSRSSPARRAARAAV